MSHVIVSLALLALLVLVANPFDFWMPSSLEYLSSAAVAVLGALYIGLFFRERPRDERENELRFRAGRLGYFAGVFVLILGIVVPVVTGEHPSPWVLGALGAMILAKVLHNWMSS